MDGIYAGVPYTIVTREGKRNISIPGWMAVAFSANGADMTLLNDIRDEDPEDIMEKFMKTMDKKSK